jgi:hypothetical protein
MVISQLDRFRKGPCKAGESAAFELANTDLVEAKSLCSLINLPRDKCLIGGPETDGI